MRNRISVVIPAAGRGARSKSQGNKLFVELEGRPLLEWTLSALAKWPAADEFILASAPSERERVEASCKRVLGKRKWRVVAGGATRTESVGRAVQAVSDTAEVIVVHDAARPLVSVTTLEKAAELAFETGGAVASSAPRDALRKVASDGSLEANLDRSAIRAVQTPQAFQARLLKAAYAQALAEGLEAHDDAEVVVRYGGEVRLFEAEEFNPKVTYPRDFELVSRLLKAEASERPEFSLPFRIGLGYDLHRLVEGRKLVLGGVEIPFEKGLLGHSDADVLTHSILDALTGATGLPDIGELFPDTDERWRDARSVELLAQVVQLAAGKGYRIIQVDAVVVAEAPKLSPFKQAIRRSLGAALGINEELISVKAKTNEGIDAVGAGEAIIAQAVCLVAAES